MNRGASPSRRFVAALLLVLLVGCQTWEPTTVSPRIVVSEEHPSSVRLTLTDGQTLTLKNPIMRNDSIVSIASNGVSQASPASQFGAIEVAGAGEGDIESMEVQRFSRVKTVGFIIAALVIATAWVGAATQGSGGSEQTEVDPGKTVLSR